MTPTLVRKRAAAGEVKVLDEAQGIVRAFCNSMEALDFDQEVIAAGAFDRHVARGGALPSVCWFHDQTLTTGKVIGTGESADHRQWVDIQYNLGTQRGREAFSDVREGVVNEYSVGFYPLDEGTVMIDGKARRYITDLDWVEVSNVLRGASPATGTVYAKERDAATTVTGTVAGIAALTTGLVTLTVWDTAYVNNLPDSAFALVEGGGTKDADGKTVPRSLRHFPHHNSAGDPDAAHVRNALARIPQSSLSDAEKAKAVAHIQRHAAAMDIGAGGKRRPVPRTKDAPEGSYEDLIDVLRAALQARAGGPLSSPVLPVDGPACWVQIVATFADYCIAMTWGEGAAHYWRVPYTLDAAGEPVVGEPVEVELTYVPVAAPSGGDAGTAMTVTSRATVPAAPATSSPDGGDAAGTATAWARLRLLEAGSRLAGVTFTAAPTPAGKVGRRNNSADQRVIQAMHDGAVTLGADCAPPGEGG